MTALMKTNVFQLFQQILHTLLFVYFGHSTKIFVFRSKNMLGEVLVLLIELNDEEQHLQILHYWMQMKIVIFSQFENLFTHDNWVTLKKYYI